MKILNSKPRQDNSVILFQKGFCQQTDKNQSLIELVLGADSSITNFLTMNKEVGVFNSYTSPCYFMLCMVVGTKQQKNYLRK